MFGTPSLIGGYLTALITSRKKLLHAVLAGFCCPLTTLVLGTALGNSSQGRTIAVGWLVPLLFAGLGGAMSFRGAPVTSSNQARPTFPSLPMNSPEEKNNIVYRIPLWAGWLAGVLLDFTSFFVLSFCISWAVLSPQIPPRGQTMTPDQIRNALASQKYWFHLSTQLVTALHGVFPALVSGSIVTSRQHPLDLDSALIVGLLLLVTLVIVQTLFLGDPVTWSWSAFISVCLVVPSALLGGYWASKRKTRNL